MAGRKKGRTPRGPAFLKRGLRRTLYGLVTARTAIAITTAKGAASATTAAATWAILARTGLVDGEVATLEVLALKGTNGCLAFGRAAHGDKGKAAGTAGFTVCDEADFGNLAELFKQLAQIVLGGVKSEISYV